MSFDHTFYDISDMPWHFNAQSLLKAQQMASIYRWRSKQPFCGKDQCMVIFLNITDAVKCTPDSGSLSMNLR